MWKKQIIKIWSEQQNATVKPDEDEQVLYLIIGDEDCEGACKQIKI